MKGPGMKKGYGTRLWGSGEKYGECRRRGEDGGQTGDGLRGSCFTCTGTFTPSGLR